MATAFARDRTNDLTNESVKAVLEAPPISLDMTDVALTFRVNEDDRSTLDYLEIGLDGLTQAKKNQIKAVFIGLEDSVPET